MEKIYAVIELLRLLVSLSQDSDGDGVNYLFDADPDNPEVL